MKLLSCVLGFCLLLGAFFRPAVFSQQPEKVWDPWLIRAETVTDNLTKDAVDLTSLDRALLWARLGAAWLSDDPDRAHAWMKKAVDEVEAVPDGESAKDRSRRLATARSLLSILASRDKQLGSRLLIVLDDNSGSATDGDRRNDANGLVDSALAVVDSDPQRAAKLGSAALRLGLGYRVATLLWQLRKRDSKLSDSLFDQALTVAGATYDQEALGWLATFAFHGETPADPGKTRLLAIVAEGLLRLSPAAGNEEKACGLAPIAAPLLQQFDRLLPQQAPLVRVALGKCQMNPSQGNGLDDKSRAPAPKSVDQLVKAADDAPNQRTRDELLFRAAKMAATEKMFQRAITLLELVSDEGRKQLGGDWEDGRWHLAANAALAELKRADRAEMRRIITATTASLRPFVQISIVNELASKGDRATALEFLKDARQGMAQSYAPYRVDGYMNLVRKYAELDPPDALNVLKEAVKAINDEDLSSNQSYENVDMYARVNALSNDLLLQLFKLPAGLFEIDDMGVRDALSSIKLPIKRAAIRLNLLNASLEQHRAMTKATSSKDLKNAPQ